jgi:CRISPR-associated protein Csm2
MESISELIIKSGDMAVLIKEAQSIGKKVAAQNLTTNQIRNVFGEVRRIEMSWDDNRPQKAQEAFRDLVMIRPKLAYLVAREAQTKGERKGEGVKTLKDTLDPCIEIIQGAPEDERKLYFDRFLAYFEAILAYHRASGGRQG